MRSHHPGSRPVSSHLASAGAGPERYAAVVNPPTEDLWSSMDRASAPQVTGPLARAVRAKRSWGGVGRYVVIYHVRARVTDEKERHLPRPPHSSASAAIGSTPSPEELPQTRSNGSNINAADSHGAFICIKTTR